MCIFTVNRKPKSSFNTNNSDINQFPSRWVSELMMIMSDHGTMRSIKCLRSDDAPELMRRLPVASVQRRDERACWAFN